jgi:hypothetical protein
MIKKQIQLLPPGTLLRVVKIENATGNTVDEKNLTIEQWTTAKKRNAVFHYRAYQI